VRGRQKTGYFRIGETNDVEFSSRIMVFQNLLLCTQQKRRRA